MGDMDGDDVVWELLELDSSDDPAEGEDIPRSAGRRRVAAARLMEVVSEHLTRHADGGFVLGPDRLLVIPSEIRPRCDLTIDRYVIAEPEPVAEAFDAWLALDRRQIGVHRALLSLAAHPEPPANGQLRVLAGSLRASHSRRPLRLSVELVAWGRYRTLLRFDPSRRDVRPMGAHGRALYFAAGHDCIDILRRELEAQLALR
jgi:hypothetical protein